MGKRNNTESEHLNHTLVFPESQIKGSKKYRKIVPLTNKSSEKFISNSPHILIPIETDGLKTIVHILMEINQNNKCIATINCFLYFRIFITSLFNTV